MKKHLYNAKIAPYVFISPFIIVFVIFFVYPMSSTIVMSFQKLLPGQINFIGLDNYKRLLSDKNFLKAIFNSFKYMLISCALLIPFPMLFATLLNSKYIKGSGLFKSLLYLPALTSVVVSGTMFRLAFSESPSALMNKLVAIFGINPIRWLRDPVTGFSVLIILCCWRWTGVNTMYFISGLNGIPNELYESADIDGASGWVKFTKITLPMLKPTTIYILTISIYAGLAMFTESFMLWNGNNSPQNMGLTIISYLYRQGIERNDLGYGSTVGIILLIIAMTFNIVQLKLNGLFNKED